MKKLMGVFIVILLFNIAIAGDLHKVNIDKYSMEIVKAEHELYEDTTIIKYRWELTTKNNNGNFKVGKKYVIVDKNDIGLYAPFKREKVELTEINEDEMIFKTMGIHSNKPTSDIRVVSNNNIVHEFNTFGLSLGYALPKGLGSSLLSFSFNLRKVDGLYIEATVGDIFVNECSYSTRHYTNPVVSTIAAGGNVSARYYPLMSNDIFLSVALGIGGGFSGISVQGQGNYDYTGPYYLASVGYDIPVFKGKGLILIEAKMIDSFQKGFNPMIITPFITLRVFEHFFQGSLFGPFWE